MPTWTKEYPTQPGFYWLRNYWIKTWGGKPKPVSEITLAQVYPMLDCFRIGDECSWRRNDFTSAEWWGPIEPPGGAYTDEAIKFAAESDEDSYYGIEENA